MRNSAESQIIRIYKFSFILIAPFDLFGKGLYRYTFEGVCRECPDPRIDDGATRIFINTNGNNREDFTEEFLELMKYITESTDHVAQASKSRRLKLIHEKVKKIRVSEKMGVKYMQKWEELAYARQEGEAAGEIRGKLKGEMQKLISQVCKKLAKGQEAEVIAEALEEEISDIERICHAAEKYAPGYDCKKIYEELSRESSKINKNLINIEIDPVNI